MNQFITFNEAAGFLKNPPSVAPRPNFTKIWALRKHITQALKQLDCPQSLIYGGAGLAMDPTMYALLELSPFIAPPDLGNVPIHPAFALRKFSRLWSVYGTTCKKILFVIDQHQQSVLLYAWQKYS
jgi:hypothetical protein